MVKRNMQAIWKIITVIGFEAIGMTVFAVITKPSSVYRNYPEDQNSMEGMKVRFKENWSDPVNADGVCGHLEMIGETNGKRSIYDRVVKRMMDIILSLLGLIILFPVYFIISIAIIIDDPGPIFFVQKRVGRNKQYFRLHKFRSMKMSTPHDIPTHMLENPESYITNVGKLLRKTSLDELPQIWDIFIGNMSIVGPRPALWNQDLLTAERDKWSANDIRPGLTGWAQINGRDELKIDVKAKLDGKYSRMLQAGGIKAFGMDARCFFETILKVLKSDGIIEGRTDETKKGRTPKVEEGALK